MQIRITHIKAFFAPPIFLDDEDKTRMAGVLNTLLLASMLFLTFTGSVLVPFVFAVKLYNGLLILALFLTSAIAYGLMQRGRVQLASRTFISGLWISFTAFLLFAGGMTSIAAVFYVAGAVMAGLLLGTRAAVVHTAACSLAGLAMVILENSGRAPQRIFPISPLVGWLDMTAGLLLTTAVIRLVLRNLNDALALARRQVEERKRAEKALQAQAQQQEALLHINRAVQAMTCASDLENVLLVCLNQVRKVSTNVQTMAINRLRSGDNVVDTYRIGPENSFFFSGNRCKKQTSQLFKCWRSGKIDYMEVKRDESALFQEKFGGLRICSYINVPFSLGVISAHSTSPNAFSEADAAMLKQVSEILSVGISRMEDLERTERQAHILAQVYDSIVTTDLEGCITSLNRGAERLHGYTEAEILGEPVSLLFPQAHKDIFEDIVKKQLAENEEYNLEMPMMRKSGEVFTAHVSLSWLKNTLGKPVGTIGVAIDITERVQAEEALRESELRFRQVYEHMAVGVARVAMNFRIESVNKAYCQMLGYSEEELVGKHLREITHPEIVEENLHKQSQLAAGEIDHYRIEKQFIHKDGHTVYGILDANLVRDAKGKPSYFLGSVLDVTERVWMEEQLRQQERLAAVGQLAAGIAHDFNNIMATIVLYTQMIARSSNLSSQERERVKVINDQAWHATRLTEQILDFGRRAVLKRYPLNLRPLLEEHVKLLRRTLPEHIVIKLACASDEYLIHADPTRIQQMLTNLAVNARDAMPEGGTLNIALAQVVVKEGQDPILPEMEAGNWIRLTVADTGSGITSTALPHIFEPFFTTKEPGKGSGLGLAQVHGIVGQHGGHIHVETQVGKGTSFSIYLPALGMETTVSTFTSQIQRTSAH